MGWQAIDRYVSWLASSPVSLKWWLEDRVVWKTCGPRQRRLVVASLAHTQDDRKGFAHAFTSFVQRDRATLAKSLFFAATRIERIIRIRDPSYDRDVTPLCQLLEEATLLSLANRHTDLHQKEDNCLVVAYYSA